MCTERVVVLNGRELARSKVIKESLMEEIACDWLVWLCFQLHLSLTNLNKRYIYCPGGHEVMDKAVRGRLLSWWPGFNPSTMFCFLGDNSVWENTFSYLPAMSAHKKEWNAVKYTSLCCLALKQAQSGAMWLSLDQIYGTEPILISIRTSRQFPQNEAASFWWNVLLCLFCFRWARQSSYSLFLVQYGRHHLNNFCKW